MEPGEPIERAYWVCDGMSYEAAAALIDRALQDAFAAEGWASSPVRYEKLPPDSPRLPAPPDFTLGKNPYCLLGWAEAVAPLPARSSTSDMSSDDIDKLREIVRRRWRAEHPGERLSNEAADAVIDQLTPATVRGLIQ